MADLLGLRSAGELRDEGLRKKQRASVKKQREAEQEEWYRRKEGKERRREKREVGKGCKRTKNLPLGMFRARRRVVGALMVFGGT
jgi:hypothetical protein